MEIITAPPHIKPSQRRSFQFSLGEALGLMLFIGALLSIRHYGPESSATWQGDVTLIAMVLIGAAFGEWRAARRCILGWRRSLNIFFSLCVVLSIFALMSGATYHNCWRCGAVRVEKFGFFSYVEHWETSQRIEVLCSAKCKHTHWRFGTSYNIDVIADGFPSFFVPVLFEIGTDQGSIVNAIERIPNVAWRRKVVDSMGDPENRLKYVAFVIGTDLLTKSPKTQDEWDTWWQTNAPLFEPERNPAKALPLAQTVVNRFGFNLHNQARNGIQRDLPGIVLP